MTSKFYDIQLCIASFIVSTLEFHAYIGINMLLKYLRWLQPSVPNFLKTILCLISLANYCSFSAHEFKFTEVTIGNNDETYISCI